MHYTLGTVTAAGTCRCGCGGPITHGLWVDRLDFPVELGCEWAMRVGRRDGVDAVGRLAHTRVDRLNRQVEAWATHPFRRDR